MNQKPPSVDWSKTLVDKLDQEIQDFDAYTETTKLNDRKCKHSNVKKINATTVQCSCGAGWQGHDIDKLLMALKHQT